MSTALPSEIAERLRSVSDDTEALVQRTWSEGRRMGQLSLILDLLGAADAIMAGLEQKYRGLSDDDARSFALLYESVEWPIVDAHFGGAAQAVQAVSEAIRRHAPAVQPSRRNREEGGS